MITAGGIFRPFYRFCCRLYAANRHEPVDKFEDRRHSVWDLRTPAHRSQIYGGRFLRLRFVKRAFLTLGNVFSPPPPSPLYNLYNWEALYKSGSLDLGGLFLLW